MAADGVAIEVGQEPDLIMRLRPGCLGFTRQQPGAPAFDLDLFQLIRELVRQIGGVAGLYAKPLREITMVGGSIGGEITSEDFLKRWRPIHFFPAAEPLIGAHECHLIALIRAKVEQTRVGRRTKGVLPAWRVAPERGADRKGRMPAANRMVSPHAGRHVRALARSPRHCHFYVNQAE